MQRATMLASSNGMVAEPVLSWGEDVKLGQSIAGVVGPQVADMSAASGEHLSSSYL